MRSLRQKTKWTFYCGSIKATRLQIQRKFPTVLSNEVARSHSTSTLVKGRAPSGHHRPPSGRRRPPSGKARTPACSLLKGCTRTAGGQKLPELQNKKTGLSIAAEP